MARHAGRPVRRYELTTTLPVFEKCMRAKGWVLGHYTPDASVPVEGTVESYADTRGDAAGHPRGTHELHADTRACRASGAASINRCLADSGWRLMATQRGPRSAASGLSAARSHLDRSRNGTAVPKHRHRDGVLMNWPRSQSGPFLVSSDELIGNVVQVIADDLRLRTDA